LAEIDTSVLGDASRNVNTTGDRTNNVEHVRVPSSRLAAGMNITVRVSAMCGRARCEQPRGGDSLRPLQRH
jgi:hypothetical protein